MKKLLYLMATASITINMQNLADQGHLGIQRRGIKAGTRTTAEIMAASSYKELLDETITRGSDEKHDEIGLNFLGARIEQVDYAIPASGIIPPDSMGAVGPTQFVVAINNRLRSFDKQTGIADGILDSKTDGFFSNVSNGATTSDSRIRYDRFSERWFIIMSTRGDEEPDNNAPNERPNASPSNNRIMFAVSDTKEITYFTEWSFNFFEVGKDFFIDYPTLGIDNQALYIGGLLFFAGFASLPGAQPMYVVNKQKLIEDNELVFTEFKFFISPQVVAPFSFVMQGVDNFDNDATVGHFIGIDSFSSNHLALFRIINPGSDSPTLSRLFLIQVPQICQPLSVPSRGANKNIDATVGVRLMMAQIRDGHLWTTHHVGVDNQGKCCTPMSVTRDGARWYEINIKPEQPSLMQYGTLFDKTKKNGTDARYFWTPSLMITGQDTMALGCSTAGKHKFVNCAIARRFKDDPKGTLQKPIIYTDSHTTYNPTQDQANPLRWGDYSYTSVDPCDDMTIWTIQEYAVDTDQWGVQVAQLRAPAPAQPISTTPDEIPQGKSSVKLTIHGKSHDGSGFFDPGKGFDCRLQVKVSGDVKVKKVKYINPTTIKIKVSTKHASLGAKKIKIINPDGQKVRVRDLFTVVA